MAEPTAQNTDRELFREDTGITAGSYYENSIHVTESGAIGMNVGGRVVVMSIARWHALARVTDSAPVTPTPPAPAPSEDDREELVRFLVKSPITYYIGTSTWPFRELADGLLAAGYRRTAPAGGDQE